MSFIDLYSKEKLPQSKRHYKTLIEASKKIDVCQIRKIFLEHSYNRFCLTIDDIKLCLTLKRKLRSDSKNVQLLVWGLICYQI